MWDQCPEGRGWTMPGCPGKGRRDPSERDAWQRQFRNLALTVSVLFSLLMFVLKWKHHKWQDDTYRKKQNNTCLDGSFFICTEKYFLINVGAWWPPWWLYMITNLKNHRDKIFSYGKRLSELGIKLK